MSTFDNGLEQDEQQQHNVHTSTSTVAVDDHDVTGPVSKKLKGLTAILKNIEKEDEDKQCTPLTHEQQIDNKIPSYLDFPIAEIETSPLVWWKAEYRRFPTLSQLAKKYLCIPATSVPSERVFSSGGHIVSSLRARLHPKNVSKPIFCHKTCNNYYTCMCICMIIVIIMENMMIIVSKIINNRPTLLLSHILLC